jgi:hypothetical protein
VLILSWAYQLTLDGVERTKTIPLSESITKVSDASASANVFLLVVFFVAFFVSAFFVSAFFVSAFFVSAFFVSAFFVSVLALPFVARVFGCGCCFALGLLLGLATGYADQQH